jgi:hypothetical protein
MRKQLTPMPQGLKGMDAFAKWVDAKFVIPGTNFRFGLEGLLGLVPGVGDLSTFAVSGYPVFLMAKNGASSFVLSRMIFNIVIDVLLGTIPVIGNLLKSNSVSRLL